MPSPSSLEQGVASVSRRVLACTSGLASPVCLPFPHRTLKGKLARQHPEAFRPQCHPELLHPTSGLCTL